MRRLEELNYWDFPDTVTITDGYDRKEVFDSTRENFMVLVEEHNKLVEIVNHMIDRADFYVYEEEDEGNNPKG